MPTRPATSPAPSISTRRPSSPPRRSTPRSEGATRSRTRTPSARSSPKPGSDRARSSSPTTKARAGPRAAGGSSAICGHDDAGTFDVRAYAGPLETEEQRVERAAFVPHVRDDDLIDAEEIRARLDDPSLDLLDARAPERWRGDVEPLDPVAGRIPGARNAFFEEPLPADATEAPEIAAYCGSGVTAAVIAQRLVLAGRDDVRLYPGSFSEWCRNPSNPIERGDPA